MSIIIEDQTAELTLFHYRDLKEDSTNTIKETRGRITNENMDVVCSTYGFTQEFTTDQRDKYEPLLKDLNTAICYKSEEGSLLRLFYYEHRWYLSTFKRINAFESRWSTNKTFGELFMEALNYYFVSGEGKGKLEFEENDLFDVFCNTLDREVVYTFLLRTNEDTRIVCKPPTHPTVYFSGAFKEELRIPENHTMLPTPDVLVFASVDELTHFVQQVNPLEYQGVIVMLNDKKTAMKILHPDSMRYKSVRGSEPNLVMAYFRVRTTPADLELFTEFFPRFNVALMHQDIGEMNKYIHRMYVRRYIKKLYTILHPTLFYIMKKAHVWHTENRVNNIVTLDKMTYLMNQEPPSSLYRMYLEYKSQVHSTQRILH